VVAAELGISMSGPPENVTTELGTITVPTAHLSVNVFSQQDPVTLNIGILPDESPRVLRRLQHLREWSHEKIKQVFPRGT
jgi:hypothetical protein